MKFSININAPKEKVWRVLFDDITYRQWTTPFHEGSYAKGTWEKGSHIHFLGPDGRGMYGIIEENIPNEYMAIKQIGELANFEELPVDEKASAWGGSMETYRLIPHEDSTELIIELGGDDYNTPDEMSQAFYPAMDIIKKLSESPVKITISTTVNNTIENVWKHWTAPEHIMQWTFAGDDWHAPSATNDLKPGGEFTTRMEAKDGSFGFDFGGKYSKINEEKHIVYDMTDGRQVEIDFTPEADGIKITETFDAENQNSYDMQQFGWQAIMDNFKKYSESNK